MLPDNKTGETRLLFVGVLVLCAAVIWVRTATVKATYRYVQQEKELYLLEKEMQGARIRWLQLTAPKRLEGVARTLGLSAPKRNQVLRYEATPTALTRNP